MGIELECMGLAWLIDDSRAVLHSLALRNQIQMGWQLEEYPGYSIVMSIVLQSADIEISSWDPKYETS
jgi:hypothetical protein